MKPDAANCKAYFNGLAAGWDAKDASCPAWLGAVAFLCGARPGARVLDIACGTGVMFPALLERGAARVTGVDIAEGMAAIARSKFAAEPRIDVICADFLGLDAGPFDVALLYNAYPHFPDKAALLRKAASLLPPGGRFTIAHGMGREALNRHHGNVPGGLSTPLGPASTEAAAWAPYFQVDMQMDTPELYLVSGVQAR